MSASDTVVGVDADVCVASATVWVGIKVRVGLWWWWWLRRRKEV